MRATGRAYDLTERDELLPVRWKGQRHRQYLVQWNGNGRLPV